MSASGWIDSEVEEYVRAASPTTILTPVDLLDRTLSADFLTRFGGQVSFNPVRTARAGIFVQVSKGRRHLIWDKEFFRRLLAFLTVIEIFQESDRTLAFREATYDLAALLAFQEGNFITSSYLAWERCTLSEPTERDRYKDLTRRNNLLTGSPTAWRLTNVSRVFCYLHESAHCEAAFSAEGFAVVREAIDEWPEFARELVREVAAKPCDSPAPQDFMNDLAALYLSQRGWDVAPALAALDLAFAPQPNRDEVTCDFAAISDLVRLHPIHAPDDFADVFIGVTVTWLVFDFIETIRVMFSALVAGDENVEAGYHHGAERNFLRGVMLISELRRKTQTSLDQARCEDVLLTRMADTSMRFIEVAMRQLDEIRDRYLFSREFWMSHRTVQRTLGWNEQDELFKSLQEYFLLTDYPRTKEGNENSLWARSLSLQSFLAHQAGEKPNFSTGFTASLSVHAPSAFSQFVPFLERQNEKKTR